MKIISIVGARPQIIKAAALSRAIEHKFSTIDEVIVHTGQHYDANMSQVFFEELGIPQPAINLQVGSGSHGDQTSLMIQKIEKVLLDNKPDAVVVYGDTNSTLATAIAASKIHVPIVHVEAGLRSYNKRMPEEVNRILCDHTSTLLFSPTPTGYQNLMKEGFSSNKQVKASADHPNIYHCGDVMFDNSLYFSKISDEKSTIMDTHNLKRNQFILGTIHRNDNTDDPIKLNGLFDAFLRITEEKQVKLVLPLHPRTKKMMEKSLKKSVLSSIEESDWITILPPASFLDIIALEKNSRLIITDSGGLQKEAYFFNKPCVILRPQTEWVEIVEAGSAVIADTDSNTIFNAATMFLDSSDLEFPPIFGDGNAAEFIANELINQFA